MLYVFAFTKLFGNNACATSSKRRIIDESLKIRGLYEEKISIFTFARAGLSAGVGSKGFVWLDYFTEHKNIEKLTREVVVSLIREIKVFDKTHIEVVFDFDDCYKECLNVIASQGHSVEVDSTGKLNIRLKEAV